jgi:ketosteroid isomerase-like protein
VTRGRDNLISLYSGYGRNIRLARGDALLVHPSDNGRVVTLEYEVHGKILASNAAYDNRFVSIATIEHRKIVCWRDYMDSLAAWTALTKPA